MSVVRPAGVLVLLVGCGARTELYGLAHTDAGVDVAVVDAAASCSPLTLVSHVDNVSALLVDGDYLYFNGDVGRVPKAGGSVYKFNNQAASPAIDLAVDGQNIYWTDGSTVHNKRKLATDSYDPEWLGTFPTAYGVAVDATAVYVTGAPSNHGPIHGFAIWKLPFVGTPSGTPLVTIETADATGTHIAVGADGLYAMMGGATGGVIRTDTRGSFIDTLALVDMPDAMALDATGVYLTVHGQFPGTMRVDTASQVMPFYYTQISSLQPTAVAIDATSVYWTDGLHGVVDSAPKGQATVTAVVKGSVSDGFFPAAVAVDDACLYYATAAPESRVFRAPKH